MQSPVRSFLFALSFVSLTANDDERHGSTQRFVSTKSPFLRSKKVSRTTAIKERKKLYLVIMTPFEPFLSDLPAEINGNTNMIDASPLARKVGRIRL